MNMKLYIQLFDHYYKIKFVFSCQWRKLEIEGRMGLQREPNEKLILDPIHKNHAEKSIIGNFLVSSLIFFVIRKK